VIGNYDIRFCEESEVADLQKFIGEHWKPNHVLALSRELLDWQHLDRETGTYNFVIARHRSSGEIHAAYGFIPTSLFDPALESAKDYWPAVWKARDDVGAPGLGMFVYYYFVKQKKPRSLSGFGMNPDLAPLARKISHAMGMLDHFYMLNPEKRDHALVGGFAERFISGAEGSDAVKLVRIDSENFSERASEIAYRPSARDVPAKSILYLENRYVRHPFYDYACYRVERAGRPEAIVVMRLASHNAAHALRIVDYFGETSSLVGARCAFEALLVESDAEYIDFYQLGLEHADLFAAGFMLRGSDDGIVIPNYFEPYEQRNVELDYVIYTDVSEFDFRFVKGDCDQDRPNALP
jgi:hypothetical protein